MIITSCSTARKSLGITLFPSQHTHTHTHTHSHSKIIFLKLTNYKSLFKNMLVTLKQFTTQDRHFGTLLLIYFFAQTSKICFQSIQVLIFLGQEVFDLQFHHKTASSYSTSHCSHLRGMHLLSTDWYHLIFLSLTSLVTPF